MFLQNLLHLLKVFLDHGSHLTDILEKLCVFFSRIRISTLIIINFRHYWFNEYFYTFLVFGILRHKSVLELNNLLYHRLELIYVRWFRFFLLKKNTIALQDFGDDLMQMLEWPRKLGFNLFFHCEIVFQLIKVSANYLLMGLEVLLHLWPRHSFHTVLLLFYHFFIFIYESIQ